MYIDGKKFTTVEEFYPQGLSCLPRDKMWGEFFLAGTAGAYCSGKDEMIRLVGDLMKGNRYLEIGTFDGVILSCLAQLYPSKEFHAIDIFKAGEATNSGCLKYFIDNNSRFDNVYLYIGTSVEVKDQLEGQFDLILIDGNHSYEWVKIDIQTMRPFVRIGGVMVFHDYDNKNVRRAIDEEVNNLEAYKKGEFHYARRIQ
jgi:predicted O-methyltransferase YrrM